ncbi:LANO_0G12090g1_1 [Lachancea nothofagi CBS 11611]|uniref:LANO_0G12090g1_1 n=1 Tax=Lachancea nothofagi CBS 11611 TaxID=1266666 RepID=A0A1G4KJL4_9SACH|nr:LANO_0G12090g1_1 [Lachancea nothofagi CBS 11611]
MWALRNSFSILRQNPPSRIVRWQRFYVTASKSKLNGHQLKDQEKLQSLGRSLGFDRYGILFGDFEEFSKCLYPKKHSVVNFPDGKAYQLAHLQILGGSLLRLSLLRSFLEVFKKSTQDVCGLDFNYEAKMSHLSASKRSPDMLLKHFIRGRYDRLARLPMPESVVPLRIQRVFDQRSFHAVIGYVSLINDENAVSILLRDNVARPVIKGVFGH